MRALFLLPGDGVSQLQALPAVDATARQLGFSLQVACDAAVAGVWKLLPSVEKVIPFSFSGANLADWANLLGSVRDPDFQACINLASGTAVDLMLAMSHIPTRVAAGGFSATTTVAPPSGGWPAEALAAYLRPIGVNLDAGAFRLTLPAEAMAEARASLPAGEGPLLLLVPGGFAGDWPGERWQELPGRIRRSLTDLRCRSVPAAGSSAEALLRQAALVAASDVVLASDPISIELALLCGVPVVALGRSPDTLPRRPGVEGLAGDGDLPGLSGETVLTALGLG